MNEQIVDIAIKANDQTGNEFDLNYKPLDAFLEKFAELIVKETLQVARAGIEYGDGMEDAVYRYFGVE